MTINHCRVVRPGSRKLAGSNKRELSKTSNQQLSQKIVEQKKTERQIQMLVESMGVTEEQLRDMQDVRLEFPKGGTIYQFSLGKIYWRIG